MLSAHEVELIAQQLFEAYRFCASQQGYGICIPTLTWQQEPEFYKDIWRNFVHRARFILSKASPSEN